MVSLGHELCELEDSIQAAVSALDRFEDPQHTPLSPSRRVTWQVKEQWLQEALGLVKESRDRYDYVKGALKGLSASEREPWMDSIRACHEALKQLVARAKDVRAELETEKQSMANRKTKFLNRNSSDDASTQHAAQGWDSRTDSDHDHQRYDSSDAEQQGGNFQADSRNSSYAELRERSSMVSSSIMEDDRSVRSEDPHSFMKAELELANRDLDEANEFMMSLKKKAVINAEQLDELVGLAESARSHLNNCKNFLPKVDAETRSTMTIEAKETQDRIKYVVDQISALNSNQGDDAGATISQSSNEFIESEGSSVGERNSATVATQIKIIHALFGKYSETMEVKVSRLITEFDESLSVSLEFLEDGDLRQATAQLEESKIQLREVFHALEEARESFKDIKNELKDASPIERKEFNDQFLQAQQGLKEFIKAARERETTLSQVEVDIHTTINARGGIIDNDGSSRPASSEIMSSDAMSSRMSDHEADEEHIMNQEAVETIPPQKASAPSQGKASVAVMASVATPLSPTGESSMKEIQKKFNELRYQVEDDLDQLVRNCRNAGSDEPSARSKLQALAATLEGNIQRLDDLCSVQRQSVTTNPRLSDSWNSLVAQNESMLVKFRSDMQGAREQLGPAQSEARVASMHGKSAKDESGVSSKRSAVAPSREEMQSNYGSEIADTEQAFQNALEATRAQLALVETPDQEPGVILQAAESYLVDAKALYEALVLQVRAITDSLKKKEIAMHLKKQKVEMQALLKMYLDYRDRLDAGEVLSPKQSRITRTALDSEEEEVIFYQDNVISPKPKNRSGSVGPKVAAVQNATQEVTVRLGEAQGPDSIRGFQRSSAVLQFLLEVLQADVDALRSLRDALLHGELLREAESMAYEARTSFDGARALYDSMNDDQKREYSAQLKKNQTMLKSLIDQLSIVEPKAGSGIESAEDQIADMCENLQVMMKLIERILISADQPDYREDRVSTLKKLQPRMDRTRALFDRLKQSVKELPPGSHRSVWVPSIKNYHAELKRLLVEYSRITNSIKGGESKPPTLDSNLDIMSNIDENDFASPRRKGEADVFNSPTAQALMNDGAKSPPRAAAAKPDAASKSSSAENSGSKAPTRENSDVSVSDGEGGGRPRKAKCCCFQ